MLRKIIIIALGILSFSTAFAQINQDTTQNTKLIIQNDSNAVFSDSALIAEQHRMDSIAQREKFVKDSLYRRAQILDSVVFLKKELPRLIDAAIKTVNEEIIVYTDPVNIIGDSALSDFTYRILSQKIEDPYSPWRVNIQLKGKSFRIKTDTIKKEIISVRSPEISYSFDYDQNRRIVRMNGQSTILRKNSGNYYKYPIDSVFFDRNGRVKMIKKYVHYFEADDKYKKGASLYIDLEQIKEFDYFSDGALSNYRLINYCDRWVGGKSPAEVCLKVNYSITREGNKFTVIRKNEPENTFSDGTFIFEFDDNFDLKHMEFTNANKSLSRKCIVELNADKNVSRYLYEKDGIINRTLLMNYNNKPNAKNKVEIVECFFEDDGISYFQKNLTTHKSRSRNKLTMEWSPWK